MKKIKYQLQETNTDEKRKICKRRKRKLRKGDDTIRESRNVKKILDKIPRNLFPDGINIEYKDY